MEIINVKNLKKSFGSLEIIKDVSFSVVKGEVLSIIGPSGSGKSTMLRCISQLEEVTDGTIKICGETLVENLYWECINYWGESENMPTIEIDK